MLISPTTPNLPDYIAFLSNVAGIPPIKTPALFPTFSSTATGGGTATLVDFNQAWTSNQWVGYAVLDVTQNVSASIASNDQTSLSFAQALANAVLPGDQYLIVPDIAPTSLSIALEIVNQVLSCVSPRMYTLAVYNLAADRLINFANDVSGQTFFMDLRKTFRISDVSIGVPSSANDAGTGVGILNPEQLKMLTLQDLQTLKTPVGRAYLGIAQSVGTTLFGLS